MPVKIIFIAEASEPRYLGDAIEWLVKNGNYDIYFFNYEHVELFKDRITALIGSDHYFELNPSWGYYRSVFQIKTLINDIRPDIIHAHIFNCGFFSALARMLSMKKVSLVYHKHAPFLTGFKEFLMEAVAVACSTATICVSKAACSSTARQWPWFRKKMHVIYNGIDVYDSDEAEDVTLPGKYILLLGRLRPEKQHTVVIDAWSRLAGKYPDTKLVLAGSGYYEEYLRNYVKAAGLTESVIFTGHVANIARLIAQSTFMVMPSKYESFGLVAVEGMAAKKLVIAKNTGGLTEILADNRGILLDTDSPAVWSETIEYYLNNVQERTAIAEKGCRYYLDNFTSTAMARNYHLLYQQLQLT